MPKQKTRTAKAQAENPSYESSSRIRKPGLRKPKQKNPSYESSSRIRKAGLRKTKPKNPSYESSSRISGRKPGLRKPKQKTRATKAQAESENPNYCLDDHWQDLSDILDTEESSLRLFFKGIFQAAVWVIRYELASAA